MTREDYIKNLQSMIDDAENMDLYEEDVESLQVAIKTLEQEPKWIPVSERLPSDKKEVLVYLNACPFIAWFEDGEWQTEDFVIDKDFEPIAWMPLPEPYKGAEE